MDGWMRCLSFQYFAFLYLFYEMSMWRFLGRYLDLGFGVGFGVDLGLSIGG